MADWQLAGAIAVMTLVTWLPRMLPLLLIRGRISSPWIRSFLYYVPYSVLAVMTIPAIFQATDSIVSALAGLAAALVLGWLRKSLLLVAIGASVAVYLTERLLAVL